LKVENVTRCLVERLMLAINENIMINLGLSKVDTQMIELADGISQLTKTRLTKHFI